MFKKIYTFRDPMSGFTHFIGILFGIGVFIYLLSVNIGIQPISYIISYSVYAMGMIMLYSASTIYHWTNASEAAIKRLRKVDHIMIFVFIAASYTPVCIITLKGDWGFWILVSVWTTTILGLFIKLFWLHAPRILSTALYFLMGWFIIFAIVPLKEQMPLEGLQLLGLGAGLYMTGGVIYAIKKPNPCPKYFGFHEIFHVFVLLGSVAHFWMIAFHLE